MTYDVVVPTVGRPSLQAMLEGLASGGGPLPERVIVVDDRATPANALALDMPAALRDRLLVVNSGGRGPAAARNRGARQSRAEWIAFLDDDVLPPSGWREALVRDLAAAGKAVATQGRVRVPGDDPHEWVKGLESALWITADMAYRRDAFQRAGGFDERFPRAYREDSDLGMRLCAAGGRIAHGARWVEHPVPPSGPWKAVERQRGNADDALMLLLHGAGWPERAGAPRGMRRRHLLTAGLFAGGVLAAVTGHRRIGAASLAGWLGLTANLARKRRHLASSAVLPFAASWWWLFGLYRAWRVTRPPRAVLFDRDGTLVEDVPYNGDPTLVRPLPGARAALDRLRSAGLRIAMVTNQSGIARGLLSREQVDAVNRSVAAALGPLDATLVCEHGPDDGCACRKPEPGLVIEAARRLGVAPRHCAVVGDIESDVLAAERAGARGVLVPNGATRPEEIARAREVAWDLGQAVDRLLGRNA